MTIDNMLYFVTGIIVGFVICCFVWQWDLNRKLKRSNDE